MDPNEYQALTKETEIYSETAINFLNSVLDSEDKEVQALAVADAIQLISLMYCTGKLNGEAGEVAELVFKAFRDGGELDEQGQVKLYKELGDCMWYIARIAELMEWKLEDVMIDNIQKLQDRKQRGVLHGSGDDR